MIRKPLSLRLSLVASSLSVLLAHTPASAHTLMEKDGTTVNLDVEVILGHFSRSETYGNSESSPSWTEGYAKVGFSG